ncbi:hypothetical protein HNR44_002748 [Geomicrobium halophilum]|uniref:Uncharacterized protein n=1 Tax=Geomicrobium halophilum TaxID=549000 RepID=A0A841Q2K8_9BACL|nr:hypothetical protein [Geomicrobium halophilum]MBB6450758.1 hypothetical protein [Geomicrobium halophilum]
MEKSKKLEMVLWSIALPGFGHLLYGKYIKGIFLILGEVIINVMGRFNHVIVLSFHGRTQEAIEQADYQWLMFYPCLYFYSIWDAYKEVSEKDRPFSYVPLAFTAYFVTIGLIFSPMFTISGNFIGPVWLPMIFVPVGLSIGAVIRWIILKGAQKD